mgnify:CR=1 FL=1
MRNDETKVLTQNERDWLRFLRDIGNGRDVAITLRRVQLLRRVCRPKLD